MNINEVVLRDPFILPYDGVYYMYGSRMHSEKTKLTGQGGFDVYKSKNLVEWTEPEQVLGKEGIFKNSHDFWAPEVYYYNGRFYMFATMKEKDRGDRSCYILSADKPDGNFKLHSTGAVTPKGWECLDGTLYIENGKPYMVFCREWIQVRDGEMYAVELSADLTKAIGEPKLLFKASKAEWIESIDRREDIFVTDGPFLFKEDGILYMLWSSFISGFKYVAAVASSKTGKLCGEWEQTPGILYDKDGGHGMIFQTFEGEKKLVLHTPNNEINPHPTIFDFVKHEVGKYECKQSFERGVV